MGRTTKREFFDSHRGYRWVVLVFSVGLVFFQLYTSLFGSLDALLQRSIHLGFGLVLVFLVLPVSRTKKPGWLDVMLALASVAVTLYIILRFEWITFERFDLISALSISEIILSILAMVLVGEGVRRVAGNSMVFVVYLFIAYFFFSSHLPGILHAVPMKWTDLLDFEYLGTTGIYGVPLGVSATDIALFIVFGAIFMRSGGATLINNLGAAVTGNSRGGPAKVAVVASALMGTLSGSANANVVTSGSVTIPMMKEAGYRPVFAGAVEAVASTGGQIMPPVMGSAAFIMAALSGVPYITVCRYALLPAILYFVALFVAVHIEAVKFNLRGLKSNISFKETIIGYGHLLFPVVFLVGTLIYGYTPRMAAGIGVITALLAAQVRSNSRLNFWDMLEAFEAGARGMLIVIMATAAAGMIVGVIDITSLGQRMGAGLLALGGSNIPLVLVLGMILAILLGMGMPTAAAYIIQASTVIPAFIDIGLPVHVAHLFALYYACLSLMTPPVAITSYAASAIAESSMWGTGALAFRLGLPAYIIPFMFVYGQSLLLEGTVLKIITTTFTALLGVSFIAIFNVGFLFRKVGWPGRIVALITAILLIAPVIKTSILGILVGGSLVVWNYFRGRPTPEFGGA